MLKQFAPRQLSYSYKTPRRITHIIELSSNTRTRIMKTILTILLIFVISTCKGQSINDRIMEIRTENSLINNDKDLIKDSIDLVGESTEGGLLKTYKDSKGKLRKINAVYCGETGKVIEEYYVKNDKLIFVLNQQYVYNRPIYWDEKLAKENHDTVVFDYNKSKISESRYYFDDDEKLIQLIEKDRIIIQERHKLDKVSSDIIKEFESLKRMKK
jgi:hypothetical protein